MSAMAGFGILRGAPDGTPFRPAYRVICALALVKDAQGLVHHCYHGCLLEWLSPEQEATFLEMGIVERVSEPSDSADAEYADELIVEPAPSHTKPTRTNRVR
jgi:hypothetical protein